MSSRLIPRLGIRHRCYGVQLLATDKECSLAIGMHCGYVRTGGGLMQPPRGLWEPLWILSLVLEDGGYGIVVHRWTTRCTYVEMIDVPRRQIVIVNKVIQFYQD